MVAGIGDTGGWDAGIFISHGERERKTGRKGKGSARDARDCTFISHAMTTLIMRKEKKEMHRMKSIRRFAGWKLRQLSFFFNDIRWMLSSRKRKAQNDYLRGLDKVMSAYLIEMMALYSGERRKRC